MEPRPDRNWISRHVFVVFRGKTVTRNLSICVAALAGYRRHLRLTQPGGRFDQCIEHGLQIEGRAADHFEHVGCRRLLLQRFAQITGALAQLDQQPHVFDGDDGLVGEVLHQRNLLVGKWTNFLAA